MVRKFLRDERGDSDETIALFVMFILIVCMGNLRSSQSAQQASLDRIEMGVCDGN